MSSCKELILLSLIVSAMPFSISLAGDGEKQNCVAVAPYSVRGVEVSNLEAIELLVKSISFDTSQRSPDQIGRYNFTTEVVVEAGKQVKTIQYFGEIVRQSPQFFAVFKPVEGMICPHYPDTKCPDLAIREEHIDRLALTYRLPNQGASIQAVKVRVNCQPKGGN